MKLCFSTLGCTEMAFEDILKLASEYRMGAVELRGMDGTTDNFSISWFAAENIAKTKRLFEQYGITPAVLGTSCTFHREDGFDKAIREGKQSIAVAAGLGIPYIRVFGDRIISEDSVKLVSRGIEMLCGFASGSPVSVLLEVHGDFNNAESLSEVISNLGGLDNFGLLWDVEHTHANYGGAWPVFYEQFKKYIRHVHIKDSREGKLVLPGDGDIPILPIASKLLSDGFDGYFSLEWEKKWHPELPPLRPALESFVKIMSLTNYADKTRWWNQ